jgi:deoxycytidylate deaminase
MGRRVRGLALARAESKKSSFWPAMGCVIIKGGRIIGRGFNKKLSVYDVPVKHRTIHAEIDAVNSLQISKGLQRSSLYVYRETADGNPALAKPCEECSKILKDLGITKIVYST